MQVAHWIGIVALVGAGIIMWRERREKHIAKLKAEAEANDLSVERTITKHVKSMRKGA